ncbi:glycoside hydrolase family 18 protein [Photobacterium japonica]|uniref:glycoside hydrolase family 18 protein n=1 Tax=Photobacterium japonica TaxID=2910235 RepID=UPI003D0F3834
MTTHRRLWSCFAILIATASFFPRAVLSHPTDEPVIALYYPDWKIYNKQYITPSQLPADKITHIIYAFLAVCGPVTASPDNVQRLMAQQCQNKPTGTAILFDGFAATQKQLPGHTSKQVNYLGNFGQLKYLTEQHPSLNVLASFGGWTLSEPFHTVIQDKKTQYVFARSVRQLLEKYDFFTGIQIDWEYPGGHGLAGIGLDRREEEKHGFTQLLQAVKRELTGLEKHTQRRYELSAAINASPKFSGSIDWPQVAPLLDHVFLMSYDYLGNWTNTVGHHSNLFATPTTPSGLSVSGQVQSLQQQGLSNDQIIVGAPFYGRGWQGVNAFSPEHLEGLDSAGGINKGSNLNEPGYFTYHDIAKHFLAKKQLGFAYYYDQQAEAAVLYNPKLKEYISFDDARSIKAKADYVREQQLGGVFAWEATADYQDQLLDAIRAGLYPIPETQTSPSAAPFLQTSRIPASENGQQNTPSNVPQTNENSVN